MALTFKEPHVIRATYRIVTPMFIGDADQKASGISPASVKGALRFWWRALRWGQIRIRNEIQSDTAALQRLHKEEADLFGTSADNGRAARFILRVTSDARSAVLTTPQSGIQYLLGQGLYHFNNGYLRPALAADALLTIELYINPKSDKQSQIEYDTQNTQLAQTLLILGLLGGLGSRARKGFGSLAIESLTNGKEKVAIPKNIAELTDIISRWIHTVGLPPFTAFSSKTRIDITAQGTKPLDILNKVGEEQQLYRSYGRADHSKEHKIAGKIAEQNFKQDHDLVANIIANRQALTIPKRSIFGLPHNYFFSSNGKKADFSPIAANRTRRASPLFIHVHQFPDKKAVVIQTLLPSEFLPDRTALEFKMGNKPNDKVQVLFNEQAMIDWQLIHTYMDRFAERVRIL